MRAGGRRAAELARRMAHVLAARPQSRLVGAYVAGLALERAGGAVLVLAAAGALWPVAVPAAAVASAGAVLLGGLVASQREQRLGHSDLRPVFGRELAGTAVLLEAPRAGTFGGASALARLEGPPGAGRGETVLLRVRDRLRGAGPGRVVRFAGELRPLAGWEAWAARRRAHAALEAESAALAARRRGGLLGAVDRARERAQRALTARLPAREGALLRGMVLGQDEALPDQTRNELRAAGLAHVVAASGQNIALLGAMSLPVLAAMGLGLRGRLFALGVLIALYVPLAGGGASIQRAGIMGAATLLALGVGRRPQRWHALLLAAAGTLTLEPRALADPGWQLSFAAVTAILVLAEPLAGALGRAGWPRFLAQVTGMTAAAGLATAPLLALYFDRVSLVSLPVNIVAAPIVALVMWIGMVAAAAAQLDPAASAFAVPALPLLGFLEGLAGRAAALPYSTLAVGPLPVAAAAGGITAGLAIACRADLRPAPRRRAAATVAVIGLAAAALAAGVSPNPGFGPVPSGGARISFLDVGQGDATLIQAGGYTVLVDGGGPDAPILDRLARAGVGGLDLLVVTHADTDHSGGLAGVVRTYPVKLLLDGGDGGRTREYRALRAAAAERGVRAVRAVAGQRLRVGPLVIDVRSPPREPPGPSAREDPNARSVVARVSYGSFDLWLPADAEAAVTSDLAVGPVEAMKVPHHGSDDPGGEGELARLRPQVAVIEVGAGNPYGHPTPSTLKALAVVPQVYRTDRDGSVVLDVAAGRMTVRTSP